jgi:DNA polymerase-3 subunit delta'
MDFRVYLQNHQPFVYKTFTNAIKQNKIAQTYLVKGNEGAPILEVAMFLAKSLICEEDSSLACSSCLSCIRFEDSNYADFMLLDGNKQTLKVSDIEALQEFLSASCMEKKGKKIYIINYLENSNKETLNALLKTLEEPFENVYAFITTQNENKLLPTILSRCQILNLLPSERSSIKDEVLEKGVSIDDTEILSSLYNNVDTIMNNIENETYKVCKECLFDTLDALEQSPLKTLLYVQSELINKIKTKEQARLYLDLLAIAFKDILLAQLEQEIVLEIYAKTINKIASNLKDVEKIYLEIMLSRGKIESNVSISLLLEHIFITMIQGGNVNGK